MDDVWTKKFTQMIMQYNQSRIDECVKCLSEKYEFDQEEASNHLRENIVFDKKKSNTKANTVEKPFSYDDVEHDKCIGIRTCGRLFLQCKATKVNDKYCNACLKQCDKNDDGLPDNYTVEERKMPNYTNRKGIKPINYGVYLAKNKIDPKSLSFDIDPELLTSTLPKRGRPKVKSHTLSISSIYDELIEQEHHNIEESKTSTHDSLSDSLYDESYNGECDLSDKITGVIIEQDNKKFIKTSKVMSNGKFGCIKYNESINLDNINPSAIKPPVDKKDKIGLLVGVWSESKGKIVKYDSLS